jgi:hypothetical protein
MKGADDKIPPAPKWLEPYLQEFVLWNEEEENEPAEFDLGFI